MIRSSDELGSSYEAIYTYSDKLDCSICTSNLFHSIAIHACTVHIRVHCMGTLCRSGQLRVNFKSTAFIYDYVRICAIGGYRHFATNIIKYIVFTDYIGCDLATLEVAKLRNCPTCQALSDRYRCLLPPT